MATYLSVLHNGGFSPDIIQLLTQCYYQHRGTRLKCHEEFFLYLQPMIPTERFDIFPPDWGMLRRSRCVQILYGMVGTQSTNYSKNTHTLRTCSRLIMVIRYSKSKDQLGNKVANPARGQLNREK